MDDNNNNNKSNQYTNNSQISPLLLGHLLSSSATTSSGAAGTSSNSHPKERQMPFSAYSHLAGTQLPFLACSAGEDAAAAAPWCDPASLLHGAKSSEDLDGYNSESEEQDGADISEEPSKPLALRTSGSKRSRAAEVHNLSEKRRRSRINEKMKALQKLIPNSNKTDKASMLDEAIDYLKQLQLQVQMLSMRNGLNLHPMYMPGALQSLQGSQMCLGFNADNTSAMNMGMGMLPAGRDSSTPSSFELPNQCTPAHQSLIPNINDQVAKFGIEPSRSQHGSFHLPVAAEGVYADGIVPHQQLNADQTTRPEETEMQSLSATSLPFDASQSSLLVANHLEAQILSRGISQDELPKHHDDQILMQHMHGDNEVTAPVM